MKILGLISSPTDPASRTRIMQYESWLKEEKAYLYCKYFLPLRDADPAGWAKLLRKMTGISEWRSSDLVKSAGRIPLLFNQSGYDLIWQNRLIQLKHSFWEKRLKKPVVFDFDDSIWINEGEKQVSNKIKHSQMIFAGNAFLADYANKYHSNVKIVPTTIDTERLFPLPARQDIFTIGWIGTKSNFQYLEMIKAPLFEFLSSHKDSRLLIISSELPDFLAGKNEQVSFKKWEPERENEYLNECSVGIMPLTDSEWTRGKCGYKLLQYLACGKPVVASPIGVNAQILREADIGLDVAAEKDWVHALEKIKNDPDYSFSFSKNGRKLVLDKYS